MSTALTKEDRRLRYYRANPAAWCEDKLGIELAHYRDRAVLEAWLAGQSSERHRWCRDMLAQDKLSLDSTRSYQADALNTMAQPGRYAFQWANSTAKTATAALWGLWFLDCYPGARLITTAGTWSQLKEQLWREIPLWASKATEPIVPSLERIGKTQIDIDNDWAAFGRAADKGGTFEGVHSKRVAILMDEAKAIPPDIFDSARRILRGEEGAKFWWIALSSPGSPTGPFWEITHGDQAHRWKTFELSAYESERVTLNQIEEDSNDLGESAPLFISMVLGQHPEEGEDTVLPLSWVRAAVGRSVEQGHPFALGCDVARFGGDETAIALALGRRVEVAATYQGKDTVWTAGQLVQLQTDHRVDGIAVDDTGVGGGVTDQLRAAQQPVMGVNFGETKGVRQPKRFVNIKAEMYFALRAAFQEAYEHPDDPTKGLSIPNDKKLIHQLTMQKYEFDLKQRYKIESHAALQRRGERSPDRADALALAWHARYRFRADTSQAVGSGMRRASAAVAAGPTEDDRPLPINLQSTDERRPSLRRVSSSMDGWSE